MLEVELKFPVTNLAAVRTQLAALGATPSPAVEQSDEYYNHPSRDFAQTDEALRIRTVGDTSFVTYKGPKQGGAAKTRLERELPLAPDTAGGWAEVFTLLGFRGVTTVRKQRVSYAMQHDAREVEVTLDEVDGLGEFVEVEAIASDDDRAGAEACVLAVAAELGLRDPERRSYLEMLLAKTA